MHKSNYYILTLVSVALANMVLLMLPLSMDVTVVFFRAVLVFHFACAFDDLLFGLYVVGVLRARAYICVGGCARVHAEFVLLNSTFSLNMCCQHCRCPCGTHRQCY